MAENQTIGAELQEQLSTAEAKSNELAHKLFAETGAHNTTKQDLATANKRIESTKQELADANTLIDDLNKQLEDRAAGIEPEHRVTLGVGKTAKTYRVTMPKFNLDGTIYEREDVKSNSELLKKLVKLEAVVELVEDAE